MLRSIMVVCERCSVGRTQLKTRRALDKATEPSLRAAASLTRSTLSILMPETSSPPDPVLPSTNTSCRAATAAAAPSVKRILDTATLLAKLSVCVCYCEDFGRDDLVGLDTGAPQPLSSCSGKKLGRWEGLVPVLSAEPTLQRRNFRILRAKCGPRPWHRPDQYVPHGVCGCRCLVQCRN